MTSPSRWRIPHPLAPPTGPYSPNAAAVLDCLRRGGTWTREGLSAAIGITDRQVRLAVEELRDAGEPIVSGDSRTPGYRYTRDAGEVAETREAMRAQARTLLHRARLLGRTATRLRAAAEDGEQGRLSA